MMKPNFDTFQAYNSLVNSGIEPKQAEKILEVIKDSQSDLSTKQDIATLNSSMDNKFNLVSLQLKALFVMNTGAVAAIVWFGNAFLGKIG